MGGASGKASSLEGKKASVESVKTRLESSLLIFAISGDGLTVKQMENLRNSLPEGSSAGIVKNRLMARALEGTLVFFVQLHNRKT